MGDVATAIGAPRTLGVPDEKNGPSPDRPSVGARRGETFQPTWILSMTTRVYIWRWPVRRRSFLRRRNFCTTNFGPWIRPTTLAVTTAASRVGRPIFKPAVVAIGQHPFELDLVARGKLAVIDVELLSRFYLKLVCAVFNDRVHDLSYLLKRLRAL